MMKSVFNKQNLGIYLCVIIGFVYFVAGCLDLKNPETIVREPEMPGESVITYTPPTSPEFPISMVMENFSVITNSYSRNIVKITEDVYAATGFVNVVMVITPDGLVIIDTSDSEEKAADFLKGFREITDKPIRYIIYTHSHLDHTQGSAVFYKPGVEVIATDEFLHWCKHRNKDLREFYKRSRLIQASRIEPEYAFEVPRLGLRKKHYKREETPVIIPPTITFKDTYTFTLGGKKFELFSTKGETEDHLAVYLPDEKILFPGDLYYASFPNLSSPMLEPRPVKEWIDSINRFIDMNPEILVPHHTKYLVGASVIREHLTNYRDAIKYVHDETVRCINEGKTVHQAVAEIALPEHLASKDYLKELYGRVSWSVRGIYRRYTGWYDGKGTGLYQLPPEYAAREIIKIAGGADKILNRAIELQKNSEHQLCAELCDIVIAANPDDRLAHKIKAVSMHFLAYSRPNLNSFGFYRSAYALEMKSAQGK